MKTNITRTVLILTAFCLMLTAFVGCKKTVERSDDIAFTCFLPDNITIFDHGETAFIQVVAINEGDQIAYQGASPTQLISASLVIEQDGKTYRINAKEEAIPDDATDRVWKKGEQTTHGFNFPIPADAPVGHYRLEVSANDATRVFEDVIEIHIHTEGSTHNPSATPETDEHGHQH